MEEDELDFSNNLADLIESASPTPDELNRLATRCGIERGSLEGKATEVRTGLLVQLALRDPVLVDRLYRSLTVVFPHINRQELERLFSSRPLSLRSHAEADTIRREMGSAPLAGSHIEAPFGLDVQASDELIGHVFISYVREDSIEVGRLQQLLESVGVRVWRDTAKLWPGEDWRFKIRQAINDNALVFLACFSRRSLARKISYQNEEQPWRLIRCGVGRRTNHGSFQSGSMNVISPIWKSVLAVHLPTFNKPTFSVMASMARQVGSLWPYCGFLSVTWMIPRAASATPLRRS